MSGKVFVIGETVWDIIFKESVPQIAKPGGSMLNVAVSLGRLGSNVSLITELGDDQASKIILEFLKNNNVQTDDLFRYKNYKTSIALAFLNANGKADYSFYKYLPTQRLHTFPNNISSGDFLMFGSYFAISSEVRLQLNSFLSRFDKRKQTIVYDPNFRPSHLFELQKMIPLIEENISKASIVRCSDEDMELIYEIDEPEKAYSKIKSLGCNTMIYTASNRFVFLKTENLKMKIDVPNISPISTIGAGDSFNAALIHHLSEIQKNKSNLKNLNKQDWESILTKCIEVSQSVCLSMENYVSKNRKIN